MQLLCSKSLLSTMEWRIVAAAVVATAAAAVTMLVAVVSLAVPLVALAAVVVLELGRLVVVVAPTVPLVVEFVVERLVVVLVDVQLALLADSVIVPISCIRLCHASKLLTCIICGIICVVGILKTLDSDWTGRCTV
ncbi:hypothetical protein ALC56_08569 [Trachymyrmex septentrionalis]|uniref:Uncharacterized protein n=1 Tax=Trachymyrmex septentrionalis TaxID=34720 RepID=A0A195F8K9_9HYME|nr:hypothetical protein ALC56_08569 [Trachymyrmex septentrionalis]